jgi:hypothetical protein
MRPLLLVLVMIAGVAPARADELAMKDLQALATQGSWRELLVVADRVKPSARDADWRKVVTATAVHVVGTIAEPSGPDINR